MGLDNRDYIRYTSQEGGGSGFGFGGKWPPVCKALVWINIGVFLLQLFSTPLAGSTSPVQSWLELNRGTLSGEVWRVVTYAFCHSTTSFQHIVFNMLGIFFFGREIERRIGSGEFLAFYLVAAVAAGLAHLGIELLATGITPAIGASGATLAILILFALRDPRRNLLPGLPFRVEVRWVALFAVVSDLFPVLAAIRDKGQGMGDGVAHAAHLGGVLFAFAYWKWNFRLAPFFHKVSPVRPASGGGKKKRVAGKSRFSVVGRSKAEIDKQVDELLEKISEKGFQSLTEKEKDFMAKASDKFGKK